MKRFNVLLVLVTSLLLITGCASTLTGDTFSRADARNPQRVEFGTVEYVRPVSIEGTKTYIGTGAGAIVGGIAGNSVGSGATRQIATILGAVAGGVAGAAAEKHFTKAQGVEVTVRLTSGKVIAVVQEASPNESFMVGDNVRLLSLNGNTRVVNQVIPLDL